MGSAPEPTDYRRPSAVRLDSCVAHDRMIPDVMARGWGRSEEDQPGDREHARGPLPVGFSPSSEEKERLRARRAIQLSLARIEEQLGKIRSPDRRKALEEAREDLRRRLAEL